MPTAPLTKKQRAIKFAAQSLVTQFADLRANLREMATADQLTPDQQAELNKSIYDISLIHTYLLPTIKLLSK